VLPKNCNNINPCEFNLEGFDLFMPSTEHGRGVAIYAKCELSANLEESLTICEYAESVWCRIKLKGTDSLLVGVIYRSPSSTTENNNKLNELIIRATNMNDSHVLITGDFNYKDIDWSLKECRTTDHSSTTFIECVNDSYLYQHVNEPTRYREGNNPSLLDLVMTNESNMIDTIDYLHPLGKSDHIMLNFTFNCYTSEQPEETSILLYQKGDYDALKTMLQTSLWNDNGTVDEMWSCFTNNIHNAVNECIPVAKAGPNSKRKSWLTGETMKAIKEKKQAWKKYKFCKNSMNYDRYKEKRNAVTTRCRIDIKKTMKESCVKILKRIPNRFGNTLVPRVKPNQA